MTVSSPQLAAAGATWADGPEVGGWIAERLAPFGPSIGHAAPLGYAAYAVVPIIPDDHGEPFETLGALEPVLDELEAFTQNQSVHTAMWDGWGWWYETRTTPRPGAVGVYWDKDGDDRAWFIGIPIYTLQIAIAGALPVIDAILADPKLNARRVGIDYELEGED